MILLFFLFEEGDVPLASVSLFLTCIPVRQAYEEFARALTAAPVSFRDRSEMTFLPPGSSSNRTFLVSISNNSLIAASLTGLTKRFETFVSGPNLWDEGVATANFIPNGLNSSTPCRLREAFSHKKSFLWRRSVRSSSQIAYL